MNGRIVFLVLVGLPLVLLGADADPCEMECEAQAEAFYRECVEQNGEACEDRAAAMLEECLMNNCEAPPLSCEELCELHANEVFQACLAEGLGEDICHRHREEAFLSCIQNECEEPPPPPPPCEELCERHADEVFQACLAEGRGEDHCWAERQAALEEWQIATTKPEEYPAWMQFYANALQDVLRKANARRKETLSQMNVEDWRLAVGREMRADRWSRTLNWKTDLPCLFLRLLRQSQQAAMEMVPTQK